MPKSLEESIFLAVAGDTAVRDLADQRVYPNRLPQGATYPCVMYFRVSTVRDYHQGGSDRVPTARIQINSYAPKYADAKALAKAVFDVLDGFSGTLGDLEGANVLGIFSDDEMDDYDDELKVEVVVQDFRIVYDE
jgi:hypothetical protein